MSHFGSHTVCGKGGPTETTPTVQLRGEAGRPPIAARRLTQAEWRAHIHARWTERRGGVAETRRRACVGKEAAWVVANPSRPLYRLDN